MQIKYMEIEIPYILKNKSFGDKEFINLKTSSEDWIFEKKYLIWIKIVLKFKGIINEIAFIKYLLYD